MMRQLLSLAIFIAIIVSAMGTAEANGILRVFFKHRDNNGIEQPLRNAFIYLRDGTVAPPVEKHFAQADYIFGPTDSQGRISASVPAGKYFARITRRNTGTRPLGPPEPGDYSWRLITPIIISENTVTDLGTQYADLFGSPPIIIGGVITDGESPGNPLSGLYVRAQPAPCIRGDYSGTDPAQWVDSDQCGEIKYLAQERTNAEGRYTLYLRNPGVYHLIVSETLGDANGTYVGTYFGNTGARGRSFGPITVSGGEVTHNITYTPAPNSANHHPGSICSDCHLSDPEPKRYTHGWRASGGEGGGSGCEACHGHDPGYEYSPGLFSAGQGTVASHSRHTENDADDLGGPNITCAGCHNTAAYPTFKSGTDSNGSGVYDLTETDACNTCHTSGAGSDPNRTAYRTSTSWQNPGLAAEHDASTCGYCHSFPPDYANGTPKANSHGAHTGFPCDKCHTATTTTGTTITGPASHVNSAYDLQAGGGVSFTYSPDASGGTCAAISCHGSSSAQWGDPSTADCYSCHVGAADVDDYVFGNNLMAVLKGTEWTTTGHGSVAGMGCAHCHAGSIGHGDASNPFRLANNTGENGQNGTCSVCHQTGANGYDPDGGGSPVAASKAIDANHYGAKHTAGSNGGSFCWDCHDPHGDTNLSMVHDQITKQSDGVYGVPASTVATVFTANAAGTDYAPASTPYTGVCQVCHATTTYYNPAPNGHYTDRCSNCHSHNNGFAHGNGGSGAGCESCHGDDPKHETHLASAINNDCAFCHDLTNMSKFKDGEHLAGTTACDSCHTNGAGGDPNRTDYKTSESWHDPNFDLACNGCHDTRPSYPMFEPKANLHNWIVDHRVSCNVCHYSTTTTGSTITNAANHTNGVYDLAPDPTYQIPVSFDFTPAPLCGGRCDNVSCHGYRSGYYWYADYPRTTNLLPVTAGAVAVDGYTATITDQSRDPDSDACGHTGQGTITVNWDDGTGFHTYGISLTNSPSNMTLTRTYTSTALRDISVCIEDEFDGSSCYWLQAQVPPDIAISGHIARTNSTPVADVTVYLRRNGILKATTKTSAGGDYSFTQSYQTGTWTVKPYKSGMTFNPTELSFSGSTGTADFIGSP